MSGLAIKIPGPSGSAFAIVAESDYTPTAAEHIYMQRLEFVLQNLAHEGTVTDPLESELTRERNTFIDRIRLDAGSWAVKPKPTRDADAGEALGQLYWHEGVNAERRSRIRQIPFLVSPEPDEPGKLVRDIKIGTRDVRIPRDKQNFKIQVDQAITVVKAAILDRDADLAWPPPAGQTQLSRWKSWLMRLTSFRQRTDSATRLDEYLRALAGIARVGLMNTDDTQTPFADFALAGFKEEFVAREAGAIKNNYVRRLGLHALFATAIAVIAYLLVIFFVPTDWIPWRFRNFLLLAAGAAVGTWLSFSIRRQILSFSDLATLEEDRLNPGLRILFMVALTTVVGLLLWTHAVTIVVGSFNTNFESSGSHAALIGALCGIAERSLAVAVGRRAQDFATGVGGNPKTTA
jgi:hypothetical protein